MSLKETVALLTKVDTGKIIAELQKCRPTVNVKTITMEPGRMARMDVNPDILACCVEFGFSADADLDALTDVQLCIAGNVIAQVQNWRVFAMLAASKGKITWVPFSRLMAHLPRTHVSDPHPNFTMCNKSDRNLEIKVRITDQRLGLRDTADMLATPIQSESVREYTTTGNKHTIVVTHVHVVAGMLYVHTGNYANDITELVVILNEMRHPISLDECRRKDGGRTVYMIPLADDWGVGRISSAWISSRVPLHIEASFTNDAKRSLCVGVYHENILITKESCAGLRFSA